MLKALGYCHDGRPVAFLALTHADLAVLFSDQTLVVALAEPEPVGMRLDGAPDVVLLVGETEESLMQRLRDAGLDVEVPGDHGH